MTALFLSLILGASGTASRTTVVDDSIAGIVLRLAKGGMQDVMGERSGGVRGRADGFLAVLEAADIRLAIDDDPAAGICGWSRAVARTAGYATDLCEDGVVAYTYRLRVRGYDIRRTTRISNDRVLLTTDAYGRIGPKGELYHVRVLLDAQRVAGGTRIRGTATGWTRIGDRCRLVRRIAEREIREVLGRELLGAIQSGGTRLYQAGELHAISDAILEGLRPR